MSQQALSIGLDVIITLIIAVYGALLSTYSVWASRQEKKRERERARAKASPLHFRFLNSFKPSISVTYSKPVSTRADASAMFIATLQLYSSFLKSTS
jgi:hypothetical protein